MKKKAIIFDMGGVLVDLDLDATRKAFKEDLGYEAIDEILDPCHQKGIYGDLEEGLLSGEEFTDIILASSNEGSTAEDVAKAVWKILVSIAPYKVDMLRKLSESYDLYLLSNNNPIALPRAKEIFIESGIPMESIFKTCYYSYVLKTLKPQAKFYKAVMEDIGLPSEQLLFIDDSQRNVDGAVEAGLPAVYYKPGTDLAALLADVLGEEGLKSISNVEA